MRRFRWLIALMVVAVLAAACSGDDTDDTTATGDTTAPGETTAAPATGDTEPATETTAPAPATGGGILRVGRAADILSTEPHLLALNNQNVMWNSYETLLRYDQTLTPQPVLATGWEWNSDQTELTFNLRQGVTFHNGKAFTAQDVKWSIERVADEGTGAAQLIQAANWITDIATPDDHTVVLTLDEPHPTLLDLFNLMNIADQETVEGPDAATTINGTGRWMFTKWDPGVQVTLTKYPGHWDVRNDHVDEVHIIVVPDRETLLIQLETGAVDVAEGVTPEQAVPRQGDFALHANYGGARYIVANEAFGATGGEDSKLVRQAINYAIDRDRIHEEVLLGTGQATSTFWPSFSPAYDEEQASRYTFDLERAQELLDQAGVTDLELDIIVTGVFAETVPIGQILQSDLAKVGVTVNVQTGDLETWRSHYTSATYDGLLAGPYGFNQYDPASLFTIARVFSGTANPSGFSSTEYDDLVAASAGEPDAALRTQAIYDTAEWLLDQSYIMPIVMVDALALSSSNVTVTGSPWQTTGGFAFESFSLDQ